MRRHAMTMMLALLVCLPASAEDPEKKPASMEEADAAIEKAMAATDETGTESKEKKAPEAVSETGAKEAESKLRFNSAAPGGESGLFRVMRAASAKVWTVRLAIHGGFFTSSGSGGFLNYNDWADYSESRVAGRFSIAWTPLPFLEAFASLRSSSNKNSVTRPELLQTQGDFELGAKGFYQVLPCLGLGADLAVDFVNGIGGVTPDFGGTSLRTNALVSFDARGLSPDVPLRASLNAGFIMENTSTLEGNRDLNYIEMYALRLNKYHRVNLGFGLDAPLPYADPVAITPFIEYNVQLPIGVSDADLASGSLDEQTEYSNVIPMYLTPGVRVTYLDVITLDFAVDIGIGGTKAYLEGVPSTPPYMVWLGLTYSFDPSKRGEEKIVEKIVEKEKVVEKQVVAPVTTGRVKGRVINVVNQQPIPAAIVSFDGSDITPVASDALEGKYETYDLTAGKVKLTASRDGYKPMTQEAEVKAGEVTLLDFALEPEVKKGTLSGSVRNEKDKPLAASIDIIGPAELHIQTSADSGEFSSQVPEGTYEVKVSAEGYLSKGRRFKIEKDKTVAAEFKLTPAPKIRVVIVQKDKIVVKKKIHFESGRATIRVDSLSILDGVVDVLVNNMQIKKVRIEGHTDSMGSNSSNMILSQKRADAVRSYLLEQGISPERLESKGYGEEKPIAPNNTRRGRAQNRRVEFIIVQQ